MKRSNILAAVSTMSLMCFSACGKAPVACDGDSLLSKAQLCPDRNSLGFAQEFRSGTFIGVTAFESLALRNGGVATLNLSEITVTGDSAFSYAASWDDNPNDGTIPATSVIGAQSAFIEVRFKPTAAKQYTASLTITSNAENSPAKTFAISGCGVPADGGTSPCYCKPAAEGCTVALASQCCSGTCGADGTCQ
jgi:hypothetical protein